MRQETAALRDFDRVNVGWGQKRHRPSPKTAMHVCFAPKATEVLHCRELTRCANRVLMHGSK
jgi:hypothetical protein